MIKELVSAHITFTHDAAQMLQSNAAELRRQQVKCVAPSCLSSMYLSTNSIFFLEAMLHVRQDHANPKRKKKKEKKATQTKLNFKFGEWCVWEDIVLLLHCERARFRMFTASSGPREKCEDSVNLDTLRNYIIGPLQGLTVLCKHHDTL